MPRFERYNLQMQITRMFEEGQSFFAAMKVQDWLKQHNQDPNLYDIFFHEKPAPPGSQAVKVVEIELRRKDGQPLEAWLIGELHRSV